MTRYLFDSSAVNAFVNHDPALMARATEARRRGDRLGTCEPVVAGLYHGLELSASRDANMVRLDGALRLIRCWPFDRAAAKEHGRLAADLKRRARPIQVIDMMLAAVALALRNCVVVTTDSDFSAVPGLATVDRAKG